MSGPEQQSLLDLGARPPTKASVHKAEVARRKSEKEAKTAAQGELDRARGLTHNRVTDHYHKAFEKARGLKLAIFTSLDGRAVKQLLEAVDYNEAEAIRIIDAAFAHRLYGALVTIQQIAMNPTKYGASGLGSKPRHFQDGLTEDEIKARGRHVDWDSWGLAGETK